jgi:hypothetical protein
MVTASMIYTRSPRQLTAKQAKRMRELRRRWMAKATRSGMWQMMRALDWEATMIDVPLVLVTIPIGFSWPRPTDAHQPAKDAR